MYNFHYTQTLLSTHTKNAVYTFAHRSIPVAWMIDRSLLLFYVEMRDQYQQRCLRYLQHIVSTGSDMHLISSELQALLATAIMCELKASPEQLQMLFDHPENPAYINLLHTGTKHLPAGLYDKYAPQKFTFSTEGKHYYFYAQVDAYAAYNFTTLGPNALTTPIRWGYNALKNHQHSHGIEHPHKSVILQLIDELDHQKENQPFTSTLSSAFSQFIVKLQLLSQCLQPYESSHDALVVPGKTPVQPLCLSIHHTSLSNTKNVILADYPQEQLAIYYAINHTIPLQKHY